MLTRSCITLGTIIRLALLALAVAAPASAQVVANPRIVEFDPSPDHSVTLGDGQAAVSRYDFEISYAGAASPFHVVSLGKPVPAGDGKIRYDFSGQVASWPLPGGTYEARVSAVGPNGVGRSTASNQFTFDAPCTWTLSTTSLQVGASGGSQSITVTAPPGCAWTAATATSWLTVQTAAGAGNGTALFGVAANTASTVRSGTLTIAGHTVTVTQDAAPCTFSLSATGQNMPAAGGPATVQVVTPTGCAWTARSNNAWLTVTAGASGAGNGTVSFAAAANPTPLVRSGTLTIGTWTFTVTQTGAVVGPASPRNVRIMSS